MSLLVPIMLFGWPVVSVLFFAYFSPRVAVLMSMLGAWLFLPIANFSLPGIPDYSKMFAASFGAFLGTAIFAPARLFAIRWSLLDLPVVVFCLSGFLSSISNGLGPYDGFSVTLGRIAGWGLPYLLGRMHFDSLASLRVLALWLFIGGLIYIPFCIIEMRMSPQLHTWVYGYHQHQFAQSKRLGGWRPTVFMQHGIMVGMWMCMTSLIGIGLWMGKSVKFLFGLPFSYSVIALLATAILCRSTGAILLLVLGMVVLLGIRYWPSRAWLVALVVVAPLYMTLRISGWSGDILLSGASNLGAEREGSLHMRMANEDRLIEKAMEQPIFGWGAWGRNRVYGENGTDITVTDGLWVIVFGQNGFIGLIAISMIFSLPVLRFAMQAPAKNLLNGTSSFAAILSVAISLYWIDCIPNAVVNPIFTLCTGALASVVTLRNNEGEWAIETQQEFDFRDEIWNLE